ncbi:hypothetical protein TSAR_008093 [Trichomalopsis sarcophagae]|uniref:Uncharacterized protein n=1 Tax=Trichomalopsis sarcophagae TaxID=543379 RepID=A0A232FNL8_9HYME|nr:hypothetical protein TSAR_008093 [Trichomalopsis sarcophagae]
MNLIIASRSKRVFVGGLSSFVSVKGIHSNSSTKQTADYKKSLQEAIKARNGEMECIKKLKNEVDELIGNC